MYYIFSIILITTRRVTELKQFPILIKSSITISLTPIKVKIYLSCTLRISLIGDCKRSSFIIIYIKFQYYNSGSVVSDCGQYLHVYIRESCQDCLWYYVRLNGEPIETELKLIPIIEEFNAEYEYVTNDGDICYVRTNKNASNFRLIKIDLKSPSKVILIIVYSNLYSNEITK
jgi:hypothetical protein